MPERTPYREFDATLFERPSLWRRFLCFLGRHDWQPPMREFALGYYYQCAHCEAKLCRSRHALPEFLGQHAYVVTHEVLPLLDDIASLQLAVQLAEEQTEGEEP